MAHPKSYWEAVIESKHAGEASEWLKDTYHGDSKSLEEIGDILGCSASTVRRMMKRKGIETRKSNREKPPWFGVESQGYESFRHNMTGGMVEVRHHRLLAIAKYGVDAVVDMDVHHKNGIPWDNRPENLELKEHAEHRRDHAIEEAERRR
jgi:hypothetical protein